jgi:hypothetical protein
MDTFNPPARPRVEGKTKEELAAMAYDALAGLEFIEMNDGHRLGFHVYRYLRGELPSLADAIYEAKARTEIPAVELERVIGERLAAVGVA